MVWGQKLAKGELTIEMGDSTRHRRPAKGRQPRRGGYLQGKAHG
jgi:hypothetical protein